MSLEKNKGHLLPFFQMILTLSILSLLTACSIFPPKNVIETLSVVLKDESVDTRSQNVNKTKDNFSAIPATRQYSGNPVISKDKIEINILFSEQLIEECSLSALTEAVSRLHTSSVFGKYLHNSFSVSVHFLNNKNFDFKKRVHKVDDSYLLQYFVPAHNCLADKRELRSTMYMLLHETYHADFFYRGLPFARDVEKSEYYATLYANCDDFVAGDVISHDFSYFYERLREKPELINWPAYQIIKEMTTMLGLKSFDKSQLPLIRGWCDKQEF